MGRHERRSVGIACCRMNGARLEMLLVCKRYTYAYSLFINGRYNSRNNDEIIDLLNRMTIDEKLDILSLNFGQMWYRIWLSTTRGSNFFVAKGKFETAFLTDEGRRIRRLIARSHNSDRIWEIPKGRKKSKNETEVSCAIREFQEETGVRKEQYMLYVDAWRVASHTSSGVNYICKYYFAWTSHYFPTHASSGIKFEDTCPEEIVDIKWMSIDEMRLVDNTGRLVNTATPIFNWVKKHVLRR